MKLLLDSCTFLWMVSEPHRLSTKAKAAYCDPLNDVFLSVVSGWEIAVKYALGRLPLAVPPGDFIPEQRKLHGVNSLDLDEESALRVSRLPKLHNDPFDRMLVCQAIVHGLTIVTPDRLVEQYAVRTLW